MKHKSELIFFTEFKMEIKNCLNIKGNEKKKKKL